MRHAIDKTEDVAQYVIGVPVFVVVAALTALVMAVGFGLMETFDRLTHRG